MATQDLDRANSMNWKCECGKEAMIHSTTHVTRNKCQHLYFCNDCWWDYEKIPRPMKPWQVKAKQKDIEAWKKAIGYK